MPSIRTQAAATLLAAALTGLGGDAAASGDKTPPTVRIIHQITDNMAGVASKMFRFEPDILAISPGESVTFLNSVRSHTVLTQTGLWPEGTAPISIRGKTEATVTFEAPGLYGITCARHRRYGMTMLIAVGEAGLTQAAALDPGGLPASDLAKAAFRRQAAALRAPAN
ncbi:MAG: plastocyanin/azurin family copper-binding protein [Pseudomonadota bacterium]